MSSNSNEDEQGHSLYGYERLVFGGSQIEIPDGGPLPVVNIATLIDPHNIRRIGTGAYTQQQSDSMREEAFDFYLNVYGLNFRAAFHEPSLDVYLLPNAAMYQVTRTADPNVKLNFDSKHNERIGVWTAFETGVLVIMTGAGTFAGGIRQGMNYLPGDLISKMEYNFVKPDRDWSQKKYREVFKGEAIWPVRQVFNAFGVTDTPAFIKLIDEDGNEGLMADMTSRSKLLNGNWVLLSRATFTF